MMKGIQGVVPSNPQGVVPSILNHGVQGVVPNGPQGIGMAPHGLQDTVLRGRQAAGSRLNGAAPRGTLGGGRRTHKG